MRSGLVYVGEKEGGEEVEGEGDKVKTENEKERSEDLETGTAERN
jgi:hypothetical protein